MFAIPQYAYQAEASVSNTGNTETGFPVFGTLNTDTGKILAVLPVLERIKWALLTKNYCLLNWALFT
jgi:hypothetical protein